MHSDAEVKDMKPKFKVPFTCSADFINVGRRDKNTMLYPQVSYV